jgi:shikimate kinase
VLVVVISGPIASGKSALSRAIAARLEEEHGASSAVIDLDLVYEMLEPRRDPKDDEQLWAEARRVAGRLTSVLLREGRSVVVEGGDLATKAALAEFTGGLPGGALLRLVLLDVDFDTALQRARNDATRGISKDAEFLSAHYAQFSADWSGHEVLRLDTATASLSETTSAVVRWLPLTE